MNIWIEYFRYDDNRNNTWAQMKEPAKWKPPDPDKVSRRFCQSREDAPVSYTHLTLPTILLV